jgi:hypothetical protein
MHILLPALKSKRALEPADCSFSVQVFLDSCFLQSPETSIRGRDITWYQFCAGTGYVLVPPIDSGFPRQCYGVAIIGVV